MRREQGPAKYVGGCYRLVTNAYLSILMPVIKSNEKKM